jgi:hypothetical protein
LIPRFAKHYIAKHLKDSLGPNNSLAPIGNFGGNKMIPFVILHTWLCLLAPLHRLPKLHAICVVIEPWVESHGFK